MAQVENFSLWLYLLVAAYTLAWLLTGAVVRDFPLSWRRIVLILFAVTLALCWPIGILVVLYEWITSKE